MLPFCIKTPPHRFFRDRPRIMGIVNINDDSFSGDGTLEISEAGRLAGQMIADGADIIDVGAESARTNRGEISETEEIDRLIPFLERWEGLAEGSASRFEDQAMPPLLSVNTWRPAVVRAVLKTGQVDLVNDMGGLPDPENAKLCAEYGAILLIMHTVGLPKVPHLDERYDDVWKSLEDFFEAKIAMARDAGLTDHQILLDPGIDFAKQKGDNLRIYRELERIHQFGLPILLPISRKTVIGDSLDLPEPCDRDGGTIACLARGIRAGARCFRVHNVKAAAEAVRVLYAIEECV